MVAISLLYVSHQTHFFDSLYPLHIYIKSTTVIIFQRNRKKVSYRSIEYNEFGNQHILTLKVPRILFRKQSHLFSLKRKSIRRDVLHCKSDSTETIRFEELFTR